MVDYRQHGNTLRQFKKLYMRENTRECYFKQWIGNCVKTWHKTGVKMITELYNEKYLHCKASNMKISIQGLLENGNNSSNSLFWNTTKNEYHSFLTITRSNDLQLDKKKFQNEYENLKVH